MDSLSFEPFELKVFECCESSRIDMYESLSLGVRFEELCKESIHFA